jgi:hypothetical protein
MEEEPLTYVHLTAMADESGEETNKIMKLWTKNQKRSNFYLWKL